MLEPTPTDPTGTDTAKVDPKAQTTPTTQTTPTEPTGEEEAATGDELQQ